MKKKLSGRVKHTKRVIHNKSVWHQTVNPVLAWSVIGFLSLVGFMAYSMGQ